jgi:hypothetical protein
MTSGIGLTLILAGSAVVVIGLLLLLRKPLWLQRFSCRLGDAMARAGEQQPLPGCGPLHGGGGPSHHLHFGQVRAVTPGGANVNRKCCPSGHRKPDQADVHAGQVKERIERTGY